jgi:hypothetical protein
MSDEIVVKNINDKRIQIILYAIKIIQDSYDCNDRLNITVKI